MAVSGDDAVSYFTRHVFDAGIAQTPTGSTRSRHSSPPSDWTRTRSFLCLVWSRYGGNTQAKIIYCLPASSLTQEPGPQSFKLSHRWFLLVWNRSFVMGVLQVCRQAELPSLNLLFVVLACFDGIFGQAVLCQSNTPTHTFTVESRTVF